MSKLLSRYNLLNKIVQNYLITSRARTSSQKILTLQPPSELKENSDILSYVDTASDFKVGIGVANRKLQQLFAIEKYDAANFILKNKFLTEVAGKTMSENYELCQQNGVKDETILSCLHLLAERYLLEKLYLLKQLNHDLNVLVPLVKLNVITLIKAATIEDLPHRISFFSNLFQVSEFDVCEHMVKRQFLLRINMESVQTVCQQLYEVGVTKEEILSDMYVIRYASHTVRERINYIKSFKVEKVKPWMIRGDKEIFEKYIQRKLDTESVLRGHTLEEYLSKKFDCTIHQAKALVEKYPAFQKRHLIRLQEIMEFLYSNGFTPIDILRNPKILFFRQNTIMKRFKVAEGHDLQSIGLHVFTKSNKQFIEYYETIIKPKKSKQNLPS